MSVPTLTPPLDITWTRMAFSRDMVDTSFEDATFGPKWRSSLAVYYYIVPEEETADDYPTSRIMYLKFTCSITGYNPSESLADAKQVAEESGALDDLQRSTWEVISGSGWSAKYWPCLGAVMQLAIYPGVGDDVGPDDYPYILDFEPKKREMYEAVTEGKENLSGSAGKTEITKGSTGVSGLEIGGSAGFSIGGFGASGSVTHTSSDTTINQNTTDTSREARETLSRTTQSSQLYQLFNGYHLGSNRALFVVAPRPHTVTDQAQTEFNLIDGARKLEGVQEVFVVVHMPKSLIGFCLQAGLDTGHQVSTLVPYQALTRRRIDENGLLHIDQLAEPPDRPLVHGEIGISDVATQRAYGMLAKDPSPDNRAKVAATLNAVQSQVNHLMLDRNTSVGYQPRELVETDTFRSLVANAAREDTTAISDVVAAGHLTEDDLQQLESRKIRTMSELFAMEMPDADSEATADIRRRVISSLTSVPQIG
jgi:hypothetical protein